MVVSFCRRRPRGGPGGARCPAMPSRCTQIPPTRREPRAVCHPRLRQAFLLPWRHAGPGSRACWPTVASPGGRTPSGRGLPGRGTGSGRSGITRIVFSSGARYRPAIGPTERAAGQVRLAGPADPLSGRSEPVVSGRGEHADRNRDQAGQRVDQSLRGARVVQRFQALPRIGGQILTAATGSDHARPRRQCHCGHAALRSCRPQRPT